jgi:hypothetical protein
LIKKDPEKLDEPFCLVLYDTDSEGRCVPSYKASEYNEDIGVYYAQRAEELKRLHSEVLEGRISPVCLFFHYQHMTLGDLAKRVGLRPGLVEKHMTPNGFKSATVEQLQKYAKVFDVTVADFFEFYFISDEIVTKSAKHLDRLILETVFSVKK